MQTGRQEIGKGTWRQTSKTGRLAVKRQKRQRDTSRGRQIQSRGRQRQRGWQEAGKAGEDMHRQAGGSLKSRQRERGRQKAG
jgi:hypothetical protein